MMSAELGECASTGDRCRVSVLDAVGKLEGERWKSLPPCRGQEWMCCSLPLHLQGAFSDTVAVSRLFPDFSEKLSSGHARIFP